MENNKDVTKLISSILLIAFAAFAVVSFYSHSPNDPPFGNYPINYPIKNYCGKAGANLAGYMMLGLGITSYIPFILLGAFGTMSILKTEIRGLWIKAIGGILIIVCIPPSIYLVSSLTKLSVVKPEFAGIFGLISAVRLTNFFGIVGTCLLLGVGLIIAAILITDARINKIFGLFFQAIRGDSNKNTIEPIKPKKVHSVNLFHFFAVFKKIRFPKIRFKSKSPDVTAQNVSSDTNEVSTSVIPDALSAEVFEPHIDEGSGEDTFDEETEEMQEITEDEIQNIETDVSNVKVRTPKRENHNTDDKNYTFPTKDLLESTDTVFKTDDREQLMQRASILQITLKQFNVDVRVSEIEQGPVITMFELELAPGVKVAKIIALSDDLAIALKAPSVRVVAPLPKKSAVGLEVPNENRRVVRLREVIDSGAEYMEKQKIPLALGKDVAGNPIIVDITAMPHMLIAGTTGSGKSVCLNTIILSILCFQRPDEVKLLLVDPKMVEFALYNDVPHLITPIVTDMKKAPAVLEWAVNKMEERYALLSSVGVRNIDGYNKLGEKEIRKKLNAENDADLDDVPFHLPYIVIIVDELADLMMVAAKEVEGSVIRLSQKSRAVGIHLILATQRPSVNVVTGLIKSNMPSRISFFVASKIDSRTILDQNGAEKLLGAGDMLYLPPATSKLVRTQGAFVSDKEVNNVVAFLKERGAPEYSQELKGWKGTSDKSNEEEDELYLEAVRIILESQRGSVSLVQRRLGVGYSRAARLVDLMADDGIIGEYKGSQAREVLLTLKEWEDSIRLKDEI
ncbi:MAG: DNA translocase FtsK 4TM domain-containing protein [Candidatus Anammoxibacter sp.]